MSNSVMPSRVARWMAYYRAAEMVFGIDPLLLAAICERESRGGDALEPRGPTGKGDGGRGHGLMQIDSNYHGTFISAKGPDGRFLWQSPAFNILYAAALLTENLSRFSGTIEDPLLPAIATYNCSPKRAREALRNLTVPGGKYPPREAVIAALDAVTTNNYVSGVLEIRQSFVVT